MKTHASKLAALTAACVLAFGIAQPAHALFGVGDIVLDPTNLVQNTLNGLQTTMQMQAQASQNLSDDESVLADLVGKSQSAEGALQAMQAMNQLLALQAKQSIQTQRLQITQDRAASLELARQAAATERGREVTRRFLGEGTPYTPQPVNFYNR